VLNVGRTTRWCLFHAVYWFGGAAWLRNKEDRAQGFNRVQSTAELKAVQQPSRRSGVPQVARALWRRVRGG
jgi:hypothetical protein